MRRAVALLMMVAMVLAPCAVAHAATIAAHQGVLTASNEGSSSEHMHAASEGSQGEQTACPSASHDAGHDTCSGNCESLQRVINTSVSERSTPDFDASFATLVFGLSLVAAVSADSSSPILIVSPIESNADSQTVLRMTARLRL